MKSLQTSMSTPPDRLLFPWAWVCVLALALAPLAVAVVPGLVDYPNDLARIFILVNFDRLPALAVNYLPDWGIKPNLAMDLVLPPLMHGMSVEAAGRVFIALTVLALVAGTAALSRALHGRVGLAALLAAPLAYNIILAGGFMNSLFGSGLALLALAGWVATGHWPVLRRGAAFAPVVAALFFTHLFAAGNFLMLAGTYQVGGWRGDNRRQVFRGIGALAGAAIPLPMLWLMKPAGAPGANIDYGGFGYHLAGLMGGAMFDGSAADLATLAALVVLLGFGLVATRGRLFPRAMLPPLAALLVLAMVIPATFMNGHCVNLRFSVMLAFVAAAAARPGIVSGLARLGVAAIVALTGFRAVEVVHQWREVDRDFAEFRAAAQVLPAGARVLPLIEDAPAHRSYQHMVDLAVVDRCVFVPNLFKIPDLQPLAPAAATKALDAGANGEPVDVAQLAAGADPKQAAALLAAPHLDWEYPYYADWPHRFDYLVHLDWGRHANPRPDLLDEVAGGSFFRIFKVRGREPVLATECSR